MLIQISVGTALLLFNIILAALAAMVMETVFLHLHSWLVRRPHRPKLVLVVAGVSIWVLGVITTAIWIWAFAYLFVGAFATLEESVYFSMVMFTTLGLGDVLLPQEWRILAGMEATNGFLNFGLLSALFIEALRLVRLNQYEVTRRRHD